VLGFYLNKQMFFVLAFIFSILNILDGHSTFLVVINSNLKSERNPFARFLFRKLGLKTGIILLKSFSILIILLAYIWIRDLRYELNIILTIANVFYLFVVFNNYRNYRNIQKYHQKMKKLEELVKTIKD
jgi:hypothetical protein